MPLSPFFPVGPLNAIANALNDLADAPDRLPAGGEAEPPPDRLAEATSNSAEHVAIRLAAVIAGHSDAASSNLVHQEGIPQLHGDRIQENNAPSPGDKGESSWREINNGKETELPEKEEARSGPEFSNVNGRTLSKEIAKELALVHAFGVWAEAVLSPVQRFRIAAPLVRDIATSIFRFAIAHHLDPDASDKPQSSRTIPSIASFFGAVRGTGTDSGSALAAELANIASASCHVWPVRSDARRHILRKALAARYGTAVAAPTAALIAGPPMILFVRERLRNVERIFSDSLTSCEPSTGHNRSTASLREWQELAAGVCVFEVLEVEDVSTLRSSVSKALKDAVKSRGLSPTLLVVDADPDTTICSGAEVLGAVCESYGARLHVEGPALAILAASSKIMDTLEFDIKACVAHCHSIILDVGAWFGVGNVAVVSYFNARNAHTEPTAEDDCQEVGEDDVVSGGDISVARVMALWWMLQRVRLSASQKVVSAAAEQSVLLVDKVAVFPHLIEHKTVGVAANVLLSYAGVDAEAPFRASVNRAILRNLCSAASYSRLYGFTMASHQNREWILFSPLLMALRHGIEGLPPSPLCATQVAKEMVASARRCEIAKAGASAFLALAKQCEHFEVLSTPPSETAPLYFGAVRMVPLGLVSKLWRKDPEMMEQVSKYTCALASRLDAARDSTFEAVLYDDCLEEQTPYVCVGPLVGVDPVRRRQRKDADPPEESELCGTVDSALADVSFQEARNLARDAAAVLCDTATMVVHALSASAIEAGKHPEVGSDSPHPGKFVDMEVRATGTVGEDIPVESIEDEEGGRSHGSFVDGDEAVAMVVDSIESTVSDEARVASAEDIGRKEETVPLMETTSSGSIWERLFGRDDDTSSEASWGNDVEKEPGVVEEGANGVDCFRP